MFTAYERMNITKIKKASKQPNKQQQFIERKLNREMKERMALENIHN